MMSLLSKIYHTDRGGRNNGKFYNPRGASRCAFIRKEMLEILSKEDQNAWDNLSEDAKKTALFELD